jgi:hypothetical protein
MTRLWLFARSSSSARRRVAVALAIGAGVWLAASCAGVKQSGLDEGAGGGGHGGGGASRGGTGGARGMAGHGGDAWAGADARPQRCDDAGDCKCMNIASLGKVAHYGGNSDSTDAFQQYLDTKSNARMALFTERTTITPELLAGYDVVILQALEDSEYVGFWSYGPDEVDALATWVKAGNGLIVLTGYGGNADEVDPANQLLAFAGIAYGKTDTFASCPDNFCYCTDSSIPFRGWQPGSFIAANMVAPDGQPGAVGVFHGRPISCTDSADGTDGACQLVASAPDVGDVVTVGVGKTVGAGRVFVWGDEWVTYTSQWGATNTHGADCNGHTAGEIYDVPQFWYNVIRWVLPTASCFAIADPIIVP